MGDSAMSVSELERIVIPDDSNKIKVQILREIPIKISGIRDVDILLNNIGITYGFNNYIEMYLNKSEQKNITIPAPTETLKGTLTLDKDTPIIELREIPTDEAKKLIHQYVRENEDCRTSQIIIDLALDPDLVIEALHQLSSEGRLEGKDLESK